MNLEIRHSNPKDAPALLSIWRSSVAATHSFVAAADLAAIDEAVQGLLSNLPVLVALNAARPVGFMGLVDGTIDSLFVAGEQRGRGIGGALVEYAMSGATFLKTTVNEQNLHALGFYEHLGFVPVGRSPTDEDGRPYPILHLRWVRPPVAFADPVRSIA